MTSGGYAHRMEINLKSILLTAGLLVTPAFSPALGLAQTPPAQPPAAAPGAVPAAVPTPEIKETVKTGVIASSVKTGSFAAIDVDTSGAAPGDEQNVISGSISRINSDTCLAKVTNSGVKTYSVSFAVVGTTASGSRPLNNTFSATIKPKGSVERQIPRCGNDLNLSVVLKSAKALK